MVNGKPGIYLILFRTVCRQSLQKKIQKVKPANRKGWMADYGAYK